MRSIIPVLSLTLFLLSTPLLAAETRPTQADIQADFDAGKFQECILKIAKVINLPPSLAKDYDRYALLMLKGESLLQTRQGGAASDAFAMAEKATTDKPKILAANTLELLIKKSQNLKYTPRGGAPKDAIDIVDRAKRTDAYKAIFADACGDAERRQEQVLKSTGLPAILPLAQTLAELSILETAASGADAKSQVLKTALAAHAKEAIAKSQAEDPSDIEKIKAHANETYNVDTWDTFHRPHRTVYKRGLSGEDTARLNGIVTNCNNLLKLMKDLADALNADFNADNTRVSTLRSTATAVAKATYGKVSSR